MLKYRTAKRFRVPLTWYHNKMVDLYNWARYHSDLLYDILDDLTPIRGGRYFGRFDTWSDWWYLGNISHRIKCTMKSIREKYWKLLTTEKQRNFLYKLAIFGNVKLLNWDGHFYRVRTRSSSTAYYELFIYPTNYIKVKCIQYYMPNNLEKSVNTYVEGLFYALEGKEFKPVKLKSTIISEFILTKADMFRIVRKIKDEFDHWYYLDLEQREKELVSVE